MRKYKFLTFSALSAALLCLISPIAIPIFGAIPITLSTLIIYLSASLFEPKITITSVCVYISLGIIGLPVFSGFVGGIGIIMSPVGGFILGYIPMSLLLSLCLNIRKSSILWNALVMTIATVILYIIGALWFILTTASDVKVALLTCVIPFIPFDAVKIAVSVILSKIIKRNTRKI